jgi:hypothetical protein
MQTKHTGNTTGAALIIAMLAAVVVMMAATLLISLTRRMVDSHVTRLDAAQVSLSEASAADGLAFLLSQTGPAAAAQSLHFDLAGVSTDFTLLDMGTAGIRTGFFPLQDASGSVLIPSGNHFIAVQKTDDSTVLVTFFSAETFNPTAEFTLDTDLVPAAGTPLNYHGKEAVVAVFQDNSKALLVCLTKDGVQSQVLIDSRVVSPRSLVSAGENSSGVPLLIVTGGSNTGAVYNCLSGELQHIVSPSGTCPVFLSDGTIFGTEQSSESLIGAHVTDVFSGDFNNDGVDDTAFATRFSLSVYSGSSREVTRLSPGGSLTCWGSVRSRVGLCAMWRMPGGNRRWFRLGYDGFVDFNPGIAYELGWRGRFSGQGNMLAGIIDSSAVIASSSGSVLELLSGDVFTGDADGGETDFFRTGKNGVDVCFNPVNGDGIRLLFSAENRYRGNAVPGETYVYSIYESEGGMNVYHTLEGLEQ